MSKVLGKVIIGILIASMATFFFTLSMVATHTATALSTTLMFISAPVMIVALILVNRDC